ncbi:MAG: O-phosphoserine--tRNA ligase [Candidatus Nezhaarchaeota archaeon]|nr:O-phosphoserine--tRNA ligase [Candidatus Nezhaarchaeota archaeon]
MASLTAWRVEELVAKAEEGFVRAWLEGGRLLEGMRTRVKLSYGVGKPHPVMEVIQRFREAFLRLGFDEVVNPVIVEEAEVKKQYGPEALAILDRCYFLATLPRPDVGISREVVEKIEKLGVKMDAQRVTELQRVLHAYKKGEAVADDLVEHLATALGVNDVKATEVLSSCFPEFRELRPQPTSLTLRSHMTTAWFLTLASLQHRRPLPLKLFSVGLRFRREQQEDETHLRVHHSASCVVMDEELGVDLGFELVEAVLRQFGFKEFKHVKKQVTAKYYAPGTEHETYIKHGDAWVEVANFGLYSPVALARYRIEHPVLNLGIGVERVAMLIEGLSDVRVLTYPQFYGAWELSDEEVASMIEVGEAPTTPQGWRLAEAIYEALRRYREEPSPCEFIAFEGELLGAQAEARVYEKDPGVKLVGPAAFNRIYVYEGNILGLPPRGLEDKVEVVEAREGGVDTGLSYAYAVACRAAAEAEKVAERGGEVDVRVRVARHPSDVNVKIQEAARRYVQAKGGRIDVRGPVFIGVKISLARKGS